MFVDTSGWLVLIYHTEPQHGEAHAAFDEARTRLTSSWVLDELVSL